LATLGSTLIVGIGGNAVALDAATGQELWRTRIKASGITTVAVVNGAVYGASGGELCRLDPATGAILWRNKLKGLGLGVLTFANASDAATAAAAAIEQQRRAAAAAG
jgi:outer membrane protein assembly factor BamB